ncbi:hypothetical protein Pcinc_019795 [Petrolisthes cinctipes]|uniref:SCAN box domain-containing protein n=1 Tax=Petrolisthes cinctipes TaxID=88211 RepID=A0AAE1KJW8_PETCI|nr:hypothetical protein Pcinc_019795 [Petrolisthes cinctipes]
MYVQECVGVVLDLCTPLLHPTYTTNVLKLITNQQCDYVQSDVSGIVLVSSHQGEEVEVENVIHPEVDEPISGEREITPRPWNRRRRNTQPQQHTHKHKPKTNTHTHNTNIKKQHAHTHARTPLDDEDEYNDDRLGLQAATQSDDVEFQPSSGTLHYRRRGHRVAGGGGHDEYDDDDDDDDDVNIEEVYDDDDDDEDEEIDDEDWDVKRGDDSKPKKKRKKLQKPKKARDISYETVKEEVLKAYALVPEAYRQRFRGIARKYDETHLEFARNKRDAFTRWLRSKGVNSYETLFELILMEDFLSSVTRDVSLYLLDRDFETVETAAGQADVYVLRHVKNQCNGVSQVSKTSSSPFQQKKVLKTDDQTTVVKTASPPTGVFVKSEYLCTFCGKSGHKAEFCWRKRKPTLIAFKNGKTKSLQKEKPVALVSPPSERETSLQEDLLDVSAEGSHIGAYSPFLSRGFVLENNNIPITILRDSGSLQTLIRSGITTGEETGKFVVLGSLWGQGSAPLIKIHLNSDCFCGLATVAVLPELPVRGVDLILGNDLAGGNMGQPFSPPVLSERPQTSTELQQLETQEPHLFPLCAVTRSMAKSRQALESNQAGSSGGESLAEEQVCLDISGLFADQASVSTNCKSPAVKPMVGRAALIAAQQGDETLQPWIEQAHDSRCRRKVLPDLEGNLARWDAYAISTHSSSITHENPLIRLLTPQFLCAPLTFALLIASMKRKKTSVQSHCHLSRLGSPTQPLCKKSWNTYNIHRKLKF